VRIALLIGLTTITWWDGEDLMRPLDSAALSTVLAIVCAAIMARLSARPLWIRAGSALAALVVASGSHLWAASLAQHAFNECVVRGEDVRSALARFRHQHECYPERLTDLSETSIPGRRYLRPNLLQYRPTPSGYDAWFGDWLVTFSASEQHGFGAHK
jgi:hypothetical protein